MRTNHRDGIAANVVARATGAHPPSPNAAQHSVGHNHRIEGAPKAAVARIEETRTHAAGPSMAGRTNGRAMELSPLIVKITNAAPSAPPEHYPGLIGDVVVYVCGDCANHRSYRTVFKTMHKNFVRTERKKDKDKLYPALIQNVTSLKGMFVTEDGYEMAETEVYELVAAFLKQPCYVDFDPDTDVGGPGKTAAVASGHQQYLEQAKAWSPSYADPTNSEADKRFIAQELVTWVYEVGGQFVRHCPKTNQHILLNNAEAIYKTRQCFRDRIKESKRRAAASAGAASN